MLISKLFGRLFCFYFQGVNCINEFSDLTSSFKGEVERVDKKIDEQNLCMIAHNRSGLDTYIIFNNLPQRLRVVHMVKIVAGVLWKYLMHMLIRAIKYLSMFILECSQVHINNNLGIIGISHKLQPCLIKQKLDHE